MIDNIYTNNFGDTSLGGNRLVQFVAHLPQFLSIDKNVDRVKSRDIFKRDYTNFGKNTFVEDIATQDRCSDNNTNKYFDNFLHWITALINMPQ